MTESGDGREGLVLHSAQCTVREKSQCTVHSEWEERRAEGVEWMGAEWMAESAEWMAESVEWMGRERRAREEQRMEARVVLGRAKSG